LNHFQGGLPLNSFAIFIIIGILISIFKKNNAIKKGSTTEAKPFSLNRGYFQNMYEKMKETNTFQDANSIQQEPTLLEQVNMEYSEKLAQKKDGVSENNLKQKVIKTDEVEKINNGIHPKGIEVDQSLVSAVIWSEILGKPRSKSPYHAKRRR
jgi:hypothetical protein